MRLEIFTVIYSLYGEWDEEKKALAEEVEKWIKEGDSQEPKSFKEKSLEANESLGKNKKRR